MDNMSEEFINSTVVSSSPFNLADCLKGNYFGFIFYWFVMTLCALLGTAAQLWCLWFYLHIEWKIKQTHVFLLNHTIMELIFCIECVAEILNMFIFKDLNKFCKVIFFLFGLSWIGRPLMQICICIEQYLAVLHPVTFLRYKGIKYRIAVVLTAWLMAFGYGLLEINATTFPDSIFISVFFMAVTVISFCCVSVLRALKQPGPGDTCIKKQAGRDVGNQQKRNAFNMIFSSLLIILFTYLPQVLLIIFIAIKIDKFMFECNIYPFMTSLNAFGVIITPLLKMYNKGNLKCLNHQKEIKQT